MFWQLAHTNESLAQSLLQNLHLHISMQMNSLLGRKAAAALDDIVMQYNSWMQRDFGTN